MRLLTLGQREVVEELGTIIFLKPTFILTHLAQLTELVSSARKLA
ncbi:MAG: hypothetical protein QOK03_494 [Candidatus Binataceae bacterium]|jgi:hypothetical protein|nr:hypothetical protein [Candidatus Binataceae bacterium]